MDTLQTDRKLTLADPREILGMEWKPDWEYHYVVPTAAAQRAQRGWTILHQDNSPSFFGLPLVLVGRPNPKGTAP